jgi:hypothetical protein
MARTAWGRVERFALGVVFGLAAWIIERRVLKAIRRRGHAPPPKTTFGDQATSELERPHP